jgi:ubiquinone biosynthesis protein UbiJ
VWRTRRAGASWLRPFLMPLFTEVRGKKGDSQKFTVAISLVRRVKWSTQTKLCLQFGDKQAYFATKVSKLRSKQLQLATTELLENLGNLLGFGARRLA